MPVNVGCQQVVQNNREHPCQSWKVDISGKTKLQQPVGYSSSLFMSYSTWTHTDNTLFIKSLRKMSLIVHYDNMLLIISAKNPYWLYLCAWFKIYKRIFEDSINPSGKTGTKAHINSLWKHQHLPKMDVISAFNFSQCKLRLSIVFKHVSTVPKFADVQHPVFRSCIQVKNTKTKKFCLTYWRCDEQGEHAQ